MKATFDLLGRLGRTAARVYPEPGLNELLQRTKYFVRALAFLPETRQWFEILNAPELKPLVEKSPRIYSKLQRPYLTRSVGTREQLEILRCHYRFMREQFLDETIRSLSGAEGLLLGRVVLEEMGRFSLRLRYGIFEKEGELTITLVSDDENESSCSITFTVVAWARGRCDVLVGGLQGHRFRDEKARIIGITRGMHGLRPKALLVFALQKFAAFFGARYLGAVGNSMHIYRVIHKRRAVRADYDSFWEECGGIQDDSGVFTLPVVPALKNISDLRPNKRPIYRRRYEMLEELSEQISRRLSSSLRSSRADPLPSSGILTQLNESITPR